MPLRKTILCFPTANVTDAEVIELLLDLCHQLGRDIVRANCGEQRHLTGAPIKIISPSGVELCYLKREDVVGEIIEDRKGWSHDQV